MFFKKNKYILLDLDMKIIHVFKSRSIKQIDELVIYNNKIYKIRQIISEVGSSNISLLSSYEGDLINE